MGSESTTDRRQRFGLVLLFVTASFVVEGIASAEGWQQALVTALLGTTLLLAFWAADMPPRRLRLACLVVAVTVVAVGIALLAGDTETTDAISRLVMAGLAGLAPPMIAVGVVRSLRSHRAVTLEAVLGALCLYLLAGMFFAFVYGSVNNLGGDPFFAQGAAATPAHCVYYSFTTLATVGYGDLTSRTDLGHTLSVMEALLGQLYLVTVVSVGVTHLVPRRRRDA